VPINGLPRGSDGRARSREITTEGGKTLSYRRRAAFAACALMLAVPASAGAATRSVDMGTPPTGSATKSLGKLGADVNAFFPSTTTIHVGDSVRFLPVGFHNLDLPKKGAKPTALIAPAGTISGLNDPAGAPYWFNGQPNLQFNLPALAPTGFGKKFTYNGTKGVQSGLPVIPKPKAVTVKFTKAGTYTYYCDVHPGMKAKVRVRSASRSIPSAKAHAKLIKDQAARALATAKKLPSTKPPANTVDVGVAGKGGVEFFAMVPAQTTVPVGATLTFRMSPGTRDLHTASFGPGNIEDPNSFIGKIAKSFEGTTVDQQAVYPTDPTLTTLTPTLHGNGFWNSGVMDGSGATALPAFNTVRFGAPGTYTFYCLIHPFMKGTVTVQ
jgi:plastocyanin